MKLPDFHDSNIIAVYNRLDYLVIVLKLDYTVNNIKMGKEIFTFYLTGCKKAKYWCGYIQKYYIDGLTYYKGNKWPESISDIKMKGKQLTICPSRGPLAMGVFGPKESKRLPIPKKMKVRRTVKIHFKEIKTG